MQIELIAVLLVIPLFVGGVWSSAMLYLFIKNGIDQRRRSSDRNPFSRSERRAFEEARQLFLQKKFIPAAHRLESIGRQREAIQMLEEGGEIDAAANMLMRMQRANRAGVIYTRHGMWNKAAECFKIAKMPLEVARCAREQGDAKTAAEFFLKAEHFAEAAECFADCRDFREAARNFVRSGYDRKAADYYRTVLRDTKHTELLPLTKDEIDFLSEQLSRNGSACGFSQIIDVCDQLHVPIFNLLRYGNFIEAARLLEVATNNYIPRLLDLVASHDYASQNLIRTCEVIKNYECAAKVSENTGNFMKATGYYLKAGNEKQAERCKAIAMELVGKNTNHLPVDFDTEPHQPARSLIGGSDEMTAVNMTESKRRNLLQIGASFAFLSELSEQERLSFLSLGTEREFAEKSLVVKPRSTSIGFALILKGSVTATQESTSKDAWSQELESGDTFGEAWVFWDEISTEKYTAKTEAAILQIPKEKIQDFLDKNPTTVRKIYKSLLQWRLRTTVTTRNSYLKKTA